MTKPQNRVDRPIQRHLDSRYFRENRLWRLRGNKWYTEVNGEQLTEAQFTERYPVFSPLYFALDPTNVDTTKLWLL
jgi:hypothetical protein